MFKTLSLCILLIFVVTGLAHAVVYRCKDDGRVVFTDNPANVSPACQGEIVSEVQPLRITPSPPAKPAKERAKPYIKPQQLSSWGKL